MSDSKSPAPPAAYPGGNPPPGYPTEVRPPQYAESDGSVKTQQRGEKGFLEGCLAALCCCFLCEECC